MIKSVCIMLNSLLVVCFFGVGGSVGNKTAGQNCDLNCEPVWPRGKALGW